MIEYDLILAKREKVISLINNENDEISDSKLWIYILGAITLIF